MPGHHHCPSPTPSSSFSGHRRKTRFWAVNSSQAVGTSQTRVAREEEELRHSKLRRGGQAGAPGRRRTAEADLPCGWSKRGEWLPLKRQREREGRKAGPIFSLVAGLPQRGREHSSCCLRCETRLRVILGRMKFWSTDAEARLALKRLTDGGGGQGVEASRSSSPALGNVECVGSCAQTLSCPTSPMGGLAPLP